MKVPNQAVCRFLLPIWTVFFERFLRAFSFLPDVEDDYPLNSLIQTRTSSTVLYHYYHVRYGLARTKGPSWTLPSNAIWTLETDLSSRTMISTLEALLMITLALYFYTSSVSFTCLVYNYLP